MTRRPEQHVLDEIDRLVSESIDAGPRDDYNLPFRERCQQCGHDWHGLACEYGHDHFNMVRECYCPGAYATDEQRAAAVQARRDASPPSSVDVPVHDVIVEWPRPPRWQPPVHHRCAQCQRHLGVGEEMIGGVALVDDLLLCGECLRMRQVATRPARISRDFTGRYTAELLGLRRSLNLTEWHLLRELVRRNHDRTT